MRFYFSQEKAALIAVGMFAVVGVFSAQATTRTVTKLADTNDGVCDADCSLREAIATSAAGDSIVFASALNGGQINLANAIGQLVIGRNLTIVGPDGGLTINGDQSFGHRLLRVTAGTVSISDCTISNGYEVGSAGTAGSASSSGGPGGDGLGGGILNSGTLTLIRCRVLGNRIYGGPGGNGYAATTTYSYGGQGGSAFGGGIYNEGTLTLIDSTLADNVAIGGFTGSCYAANKNAIQTSASGGGTGGGIYNKAGASFAMLRCTLDSNSAWGGPGTAGQSAGSGGDGGPGKGGGVYDNGTSSIANCTFNNNHALGGAGGARGPQSFDYDGNGGEGYGGGVAAKTVTLTNCTLSGNTGSGGAAGGPAARAGHGSGGGVAVLGSGTIEMRNTIVAGNSAAGFSTRGPDIDGTISSQGHNLVGKKDDSFGLAASDLTGTSSAPLDPQLAELAYNGGFTETRAPRFGSAAIDAGDDAVVNPPYSLSTDQRGFSRQGAHVDIGAYEIRASTTFLVTNTNDAGAGSLRQAIADANAEGQSDSIVFNIPTSDPGYDPSTQDYLITLTSGELRITTPMSIDGGNAHISLLHSYSAAPFRLFYVTSADGVTIANLFLRNGAAVGGPSAPGLGGGVVNTGTLTLWNCTFNENTAIGGAGTPQVFQGLPGGDGLGGAIYNDGTLLMTNCTLTGNSAKGGAGGIGFSSSGVSSRGGNGGNGNGGALFSNNGLVTITNCTFTQNTTAGGAPGPGDTYGAAGMTLGGGAAFARGSVGLRNSILSGNTAASNPDLYGTVTSTANIIGGTPKLDVLANNGGPTPTIALLAGSPAINAGDGTIAPPTDQRGYSRVGVADIGAFEFGGSPPAPSPTPTPTPTPSTVLGNISTRLRVETGDNVLIGGFIVTGTQPKKVIIRGIGPSLPFADKVANPTLELYGPNGLIDSNDNWVDSPNKQAIIDSTIPPGNDLEAAIVAVLPANNAGYTAIVRGANNTTGIGVVEAYDLDRSVDSKLANISTRGFVSTGDNVLIAGTIVVGTNSQKVIVRAIGPSLPIAGALANPTLELRDSNGGLIEANDNWVDSPNKQAIIDSTIPPSNDFESAIVAVLPANNASYTAIVRGVGDTTGIAVVEVYALQ